MIQTLAQQSSDSVWTVIAVSLAVKLKRVLKKIGIGSWLFKGQVDVYGR